MEGPIKFADLLIAIDHGEFILMHVSRCRGLIFVFGLVYFQVSLNFVVPCVRLS